MEARGGAGRMPVINGAGQARTEARELLRSLGRRLRPAGRPGADPDAAELETAGMDACLTVPRAAQSPGVNPGGPAGRCAGRPGPGGPRGPAAQRGRRTERPRSTSHCCLLAEDNPVNQRVASLILEKLGYRVQVANNGVEALEAVARTEFAAVLMDVQMPQMDGLEATRRIRAADARALNPDVPIIALTAHAMDQATASEVSKPAWTTMCPSPSTRSPSGRSCRIT